MEFVNAEKSKATFKMLRRLHGHNLENRGLNDLSEAFQTFVTRAKFFSLGRLRRTWSHSAVEFMKYRRLLPMIVSDEHEPGSVFDEFADIGPNGLLSTARPEHGLDERRVYISNISTKATRNQLQSFFSKFGKVQSCYIPTEKRHRDMGLYATLPKKKWNGTCVITFKTLQSAVRVRNAPLDELVFYGQQMNVGSYNPTNGCQNRANSINNKRFDPDKRKTTEIDVRELHSGGLSRTSSASSLTSTGTACSCSTLSAQFSGFSLDELPDRVLILLLTYVDPLDRIRFERVNKRWLEAAAKAWIECHHLNLGQEPELTRKPLSNVQFKAIIRRCGPHLNSLSLANVNQLLDEKLISEIGTFCPNITQLDITGVTASPETLRALSESVPKLRKIAYRKMAQTSERAFWFLLKSVANQIQALDLRGCSRLHGHFFKLFGCALEEALLDGCRQIDDQVIEDLCTKCPCLNTLKLDGCSKLSDESISLISRHLPELKIFTFNGEFPKVSSLLQIGKIQTLEILSLDYNPLVDDNLLGSFVGQLSVLHQLSLAFAGSDNSITASGLEKLACLTTLESLDLSGLAALTNRVFVTICSKCSELRKVLLKNCSYFGNEGVAALKSLSKIEHADFSGCILVSNESILDICSTFKQDQTNTAPHICLVIGGTICEPHKIRIPPKSRVLLDHTDNSALSLDYITGSRNDGHALSNEEDDDEDDEFRILSTHRDFITDALQSNDDETFPDGDEQSIMEWVKREAADFELTTSSSAK